MGGGGEGGKEGRKEGRKEGYHDVWCQCYGLGRGRG